MVIEKLESFTTLVSIHCCVERKSELSPTGILGERVKVFSLDLSFLSDRLLNTYDCRAKAPRFVTPRGQSRARQVRLGIEAFPTYGSSRLGSTPSP